MNGLKGWLDSHKAWAGVAGVAAIVLALVVCIGAVCLGAIPPADGAEGGDASAVEAEAGANASDETKVEASDAEEAVDVDSDPADTTTSTPAEENEPASSNTSSNAGSSNQPSNASSNTSSSNTSSNTGSTASKPSQPAHTHSWKEHTAQKWVSNMVTVPDYETQKIAVGTKFIFAYDGFSTTDVSVAEQHAVELILAGVSDNYRMETIYEAQTVQAGSHQEDQGHYETYVDYYYCDCGAAK